MSVENNAGFKRDDKVILSKELLGSARERTAYGSSIRELEMNSHFIIRGVDALSVQVVGGQWFTNVEITKVKEPVVQESVDVSTDTTHVTLERIGNVARLVITGNLTRAAVEDILNTAYGN